MDKRTQQIMDFVGDYMADFGAEIVDSYIESFRDEMHEKGWSSDEIEKYESLALRALAWYIMREAKEKEG